MFYPAREPAVIAFYSDHDIGFDLATGEQRTHLLTNVEELLAEDLLRIRIAIPLEDEELVPTFHERMTVVDTSRYTGS